MRTDVPSLVLLGCLLLTTAVRGDFNLIVPGHSAGQLRIGQDAVIVEKTLRPADSADATMGHMWSIWYQHSHIKQKMVVSEIDVLDERDLQDGGLHTYIQQVWLTSRWYHTADGIAVGSTLTQIRRMFPDVRPSLINNCQPPPKTLFDDVKRGIGFEVQGGRCVAIIVHSPGTYAPHRYSSHYPNDRWLPVKH